MQCTVKIVLSSEEHGDLITIQTENSGEDEAINDFLVAAYSIYTDEAMVDIRRQLGEAMGIGRALN